jgi:hypothetical protein
MDKYTELPKPWYWTDQDLTRQLVNEIGSNHVLYGKILKTLARRQDNDDVLFLVNEQTFAVVHLTWSQQRHSERHWPKTQLYETLG